MIEPKKTLAGAVKDIGHRVAKLEEEQEEKKNKKGFHIPWKWHFKFATSRRKQNKNKILGLFLTKKQEIEGPLYFSISAGDIVIHNNKSFLYDPRDIWRWRMRRSPQIYILREIDKRPVTNRDAAQVKKEGWSTDADEILLKQFLEAKTVASEKNRNIVIGIIVLLVIVGGAIWFLSSGTGVGA